MISLASQLLPVAQGALSVALVSTPLSPVLAQIAQVDPEQLARSPWPYALVLALGTIGFLFNENGKLRDRLLIVVTDNAKERIADNRENNALTHQLTEAIRSVERISDKITKD